MIWAKSGREYSASSLSVDETHRIYAARFNERLLGAVRVTLSGTQGALDSLRVREITRRRGVGQYLIEEVIRENPSVSSWWMADVGVEDRSVMAAFMQALGFTAQADGWEKDKKTTSQFSRYVGRVRRSRHPALNYLASVAVPLACQSNTPNSKPFRSPFSSQDSGPITVSTEFAFRYLAISAGSSDWFRPACKDCSAA